jgi:hypothetical protein
MTAWLRRPQSSTHRQGADNGVCRDLDPADVLLLMGYLWRVAPDQDGITQGRRLTQIVLDGIRTGRPGDQHA